MVTAEFCHDMPKVELHVHLEGSIRPETVLKLAQRNNVELPANTLDGLRDWYTFRDFPHFVQVYVAVSKCIKTADDVELIAREFLQGQAEQNILHSEVTFTASTLEKYCGIPWPDQHAAIKRAIEYGKKELGVSMALILDIVRGENTKERAEQVAQWAIEGHKDGVVCALGIAGIEGAAPASNYVSAFQMAVDAGLPIVPHAGETKGPESIRDVMSAMNPRRIGHGVRVLEDPEQAKEIRDKQIPLEVCPSSNVCLGVYPSMAEHPIARLLDEGMYVTINSDDPPMFSTTLSDEFFRVSETFGFNEDILWSLTLNAARASLLPEDEKRILIHRLREGFES